MSSRLFVFKLYIYFFRFIFPGLGLGAALGQTGRVSSLMINKASEALVELITDEDLSRGAVFPGRVLVILLFSHYY